MPGVMIAMGRLNRPSIMVYGGTIKPGYSKDNEPLDIVSAFQSYGVLFHTHPYQCIGMIDVSISKLWHVVW